MIYQNQKEFEHIIRQLKNVQNIIQTKILARTHPQFHSASEHPMIDFFRSLGYHITPATSEFPDEIGYDQHHRPIGFKLIRHPHQLVSHQSLEQAIQRSQYYGNITHCIIITNGLFSHKDRHWAQAMFINVQLFDARDLSRLSQQIYRPQMVHHPEINRNYQDQQQILKKLEQQIVHERKKQKLNQQRAIQLKQIIQRIKGFVPILTKFKNDFNKSANQQDHWAQQLQKKFNRQKRRQKKLQSQQKAKNFQNRLKAAKGFSSELMNLI